MSIEIKLVVNKKKNKVVFAECDSSFVDVLFSFMTLPLGTIVRLLDKKSGLGCIDKLYEIVEKLDCQYLETSPCKTMLLQPRNTAENLCENLVANINDLKPRRIFMCQKWDCRSNTSCYFSLISGAMCSCGELMKKAMTLGLRQSVDDGIFVKRRVKFMVSDDLHVVLSSIGAAVSLLPSLDDNDASALEEITIQVEKSEVIQLLKRSLVSSTPLSYVFLGQSTIVNAIKVEEVTATKIKYEDGKKRKHEATETIKVKILESKSVDKMLVMESRNEFVDLLFSFLTLPLGLVMSLLRKSTSSFTLGCINNLHGSIVDLSEGSVDILLAENKDMLLNPKLPPYFGCNNQILKVDEMQPRYGNIISCKICFDEGKSECSHGVSNLLVTGINPKMQEVSSQNGGGFVEKSMNFLITSEVIVKPVSVATTVEVLKNARVSFDDLTERIVTIGETEALNLLKACLSSCNEIDTSF